MAKLNFIGFTVALACLLLAHYLSGGSISDLVNLHALLIVLGGSIGATLMQTPFYIVKQAVSTLFHQQAPKAEDFIQQAKDISTWSQRVRNEGFLSLEKIPLAKYDEFSRFGLTLLVDGCDSEQLRQVLDQRIDLEQEKRSRQAEVFEALGGYSPTMGIIGAVLGLVQAMNFLNSPDLLGQGIAVAFIATIYGVGFANFLFLPLANRLRHQAEDKALFQEMTLAGLCAIHCGSSHREVQLKMDNYLKVMADEAQT